LLMIIMCVLFLLLFSYLNNYKKLLECEKNLLKGIYMEF
jgi:hypothetical protein